MRTLSWRTYTIQLHYRALHQVDYIYFSFQDMHRFVPCTYMSMSLCSLFFASIYLPHSFILYQNTNIAAPCIRILYPLNDIFRQARGLKFISRKPGIISERVYAVGATMCTQGRKESLPYRSVYSETSHGLGFCSPRCLATT